MPAKPSTVLVSDPSVTNGERIKVTWTEITDDGGADIQSYGLEIDDGIGGDFVSVVGSEVNYLRLEYTIVENISRGTNYRMRYRAKN